MNFLRPLGFRVSLAVRSRCCCINSSDLKPKLSTRVRSLFDKAEVHLGLQNQRARGLHTLLPVSIRASAVNCHRLRFPGTNNSCRRSVSSNDSNMPEKKPFQRLPLTVNPVNYKLKLQPNLKKFTFQGSEEISVEV